MEITLELSCCKFPPASELPKFWEDNRDSMLQFIGEAHRGVRGFIKDERAVPIEGASMKVKLDFFFNLTFKIGQIVANFPVYLKKPYTHNIGYKTKDTVVGKEAPHFGFKIKLNWLLQNHPNSARSKLLIRKS